MASRKTAVTPEQGNGHASAQTDQQTVQAGAPQPILAFEIPAPDIREIHVPVRGTAPLICHAWSKKAKEQILAKQQRKATAGKEPKDPQKDYEESLYHHPDGGYGFPGVAFKSAMVRGGSYLDLKMTFLRGALHIVDEMVRIDGTPNSREDMVRLTGGVADIRYRGEFKQWTAILKIRYNARVLSPEQVVNLVQYAGFSCGVGEWRPERDGNFGTFEVVQGLVDAHGI